jgi:hypothetical protein
MQRLIGFTLTMLMHIITSSLASAFRLVARGSWNQTPSCPGAAKNLTSIAQGFYLDELYVSILLRRSTPVFFLKKSIAGAGKTYLA